MGNLAGSCLVLFPCVLTAQLLVISLFHTHSLPPPSSSSSSALAGLRHNRLQQLPQCQSCTWPLAYAPRDRDGVSFLVSFPGSGNNWILNSIMAGSRMYPCSVYNETGTPNRFRRCSITKTHFPVYRTPYDELYRVESRIYVLRDPFDAIAAEVYRQYEAEAQQTATKDDEDNDDEEAFLHKLERSFPRMARKWKEFMEMNLGREYWKDFAAGEAGGQALFRVHERQDANNTSTSSSTSRDMIVFYENFKRNLPDSTLELFRFLKSALQHDMRPTAEQAATCALEFGSLAFGSNTIRRRTSKGQQLFATARFSRFTRAACDQWAAYWHEPTWGKCQDRFHQHFSREVAGIRSVKSYKPVCSHLLI